MYPGLFVADRLLLIPLRSRQQVTERLDRLISQIKEIQRPYMNGEKPVDVLFVRFVSLLFFPSPNFLSLSATPLFCSSSIATKAERRELQVAHGLILRCFVKRWLGLSVDFPLRMMLAPAAIAVLRYVLSDKTGLCYAITLTLNSPTGKLQK